MGISFPTITSRRFPLYWGVISYIILLIFMVFTRYNSNLWLLICIVYPLCLNAIPLILLKPDLEGYQKLTWFSIQSILQIIYMMASFLSVIDPPYLSKSDPQIKFIEIPNDTINLTFVSAIVVWIMISFIQTSSLSFKHPKRWLMCNTLTGVIASLLLLWPLLWIPSKSSLEMIILPFLSGLFTPGLTGLGLYFSGMGLRKQRDDRDRSLE